MRNLPLLFLLTILAPFEAKICPRDCDCLPDLIQCENVHLTELPLYKPETLTTVLLTNCSLAFNQLNQRHFEVYKNTSVNEISLLSSQKVRTISAYSFITIRNQLTRLELSTDTVEDYAFEQLSVKSRLTLDGLKRLPNLAFRGLKEVRTLELINGELTEFPIQDLVPLSQTSVLKSFSLAGNNFKTLDESYDRFFGNLQELDLFGNPWHCDCNLAWLVRRFKSKKSSLGVKQPVCSSPPQLKGKSFDDLLTDVFEPRDQNSSSILLCSRLRIDQVNVNLENVSSEEESAEISCRISSTKPVDVDWLYKEKKILPDDNFDIQEKYINEELSWEQTPLGPVRVSQKTKHLSTIRVRRMEDRDNYSCRVHGDKTENPLITSIAIKWPKIKPVTPILVSPKTSELVEASSKEMSFLQTGIFQKQFSLIELLGGIIGTFLCTTLLFVVGYRISQNYSSSFCCYYQNNSLPRKYQRNDNMNSDGMMAQGNNFDEYLKQLTTFQTYLNQQNPNNTSPIGTDSTNMSNNTPKDFSTLQQPSSQQLMQNNFATLMKNGAVKGQDTSNFMFLPNGMIFPNAQNQIQNKGYEIYTDGSQNLYDVPNKLTQEQTALLYSTQMNPLPIAAPPPLFMNSPPHSQMDQNSQMSSPKFAHNPALSNNRFMPISDANGNAR